MYMFWMVDNWMEKEKMGWHILFYSMAEVVVGGFLFLFVWGSVTLK